MIHVCRKAGLAVLAVVSLAFAETTLEAHSDLSDKDLERYFRKAEVIGIHEVIGTSTYPMALNLDLKGDVRRAAFKYGHTKRRDEGTYVDSYRHEVAAYRLDRALGLNMVPVAVIREIKTEGAVIEWITGAFNEKERREKDLDPPDPARLVEQQAAMSLFDALILNRNRGESDQLIESESWDLRLIDHSRAFRESTELPDSFASRPARVSRSLMGNLEGLEQRSLDDLLGGLLTPSQVRALLERRDRILDKIDSDREQYGDAAVFLD